MTRTIVAMSGGKDSTALALMMPDAELVFTDTKAEFPELYAHLNRFEAETGRTITRITHPTYPDGLLAYMASHRFMPNYGARFCTRIFKIEAMTAYLRTHTPVDLCIALRADEPQRVGNLTELEGLTIRYPLREQGIGLNGVLAICLEHDLLPRYPVYMARGGCINCFYKRESEVRAMADLTPDVLDGLQAIEEGIQDERGAFFHMFPNIGMSIREFRAQPSMFDPDEVYALPQHTADEGVSCGLFCRR